MDTFQALSDPNRRHIIELLAESGKMSASDIHKKFRVSPPAISQHLKILREAKLVDMEKQAQRRIYTINTGRIQEVEDWAHQMKKMWSEKFDRLDHLLAKMKNSKQ